MNNNCNINNQADIFLNRIKTVVQDEMNNMVTIQGAIVKTVNSDKTVNVYIPPENNIVFSNIKNQTPFELQEGDSVELMLKNGTYTNCWVIAKHGTTYDKNLIMNSLTKEEVRAIVIQVLKEYELID